MKSLFLFHFWFAFTFLCLPRLSTAECFILLFINFTFDDEKFPPVFSFIVELNTRGGGGQGDHVCQGDHGGANQVIATHQVSIIHINLRQINNHFTKFRRFQDRNLLSLHNHTLEKLLTTNFIVKLSSQSSLVESWNISHSGLLFFQIVSVFQIWNNYTAWISLSHPL